MVSKIQSQAELRKMVGWIERSETQKMIDNVGLRCRSTQPTPAYSILKTIGLVQCV